MKLGESGSVTPLNEEALSSPAVSLLQLNHQKVPRLVLDSCETQSRSTRLPFTIELKGSHKRVFTRCSPHHSVNEEWPLYLTGAGIEPAIDYAFNG